MSHHPTQHTASFRRDYNVLIVFVTQRRLSEEKNIDYTERKHPKTVKRPFGDWRKIE
jgi:hypothetical protein